MSVTPASVSDVVKPVPVSAERAWKRADSWESPVRVSAVAAIRLISSDSTRMKTTVMIEVTHGSYPLA